MIRAITESVSLLGFFGPRLPGTNPPTPPMSNARRQRHSVARVTANPVATWATEAISVVITCTAAHRRPTSSPTSKANVAIPVDEHHRALVGFHQTSHRPDGRGVGRHQRQHRLLGPPETLFCIHELPHAMIVQTETDTALYQEKQRRIAMSGDLSPPPRRRRAHPLAAP